MKEREVLEAALKALELCNGAETADGVVIYTNVEIIAIKEALAQPDDEPYAWEFAGTIFHDRKEVFDWYERDDISDIPPLALYTTPPQRTWVGLTDEEKQEWIDAMPYDPQPRHCMILVNVIEAKLKEKNT